MDSGAHILITMRAMIRGAIKTARKMDEVRKLYGDCHQSETWRNIIQSHWYMYDAAKGTYKMTKMMDGKKK